MNKEIEKLYITAASETGETDPMEILKSGNFADLVASFLVDTKHDCGFIEPHFELLNFIQRKCNEDDLTQTELILIEMVAHLAHILSGEKKTKQIFINDLKMMIDENL